MPLAKITGTGLASIAALVSILWGCILTESSIVRSARWETAESLQRLRILRQSQTEPASVPVKAPKRCRPAIG